MSYPLSERRSGLVGVCEFGPEPGCADLHHPASQCAGDGRGARSSPQYPAHRRHLHSQYVRRRSHVAGRNRQAWLNNSNYGYVELAPGADPRLVEKKFTAVIDRSVDLAKLVGVRMPASQVMTPQPHALPRRASFQRPLWRDDPGRKLDHGLWLCRNRDSDSSGRLLQLSPTWRQRERWSGRAKSPCARWWGPDAASWWCSSWASRS